MRSAKRWPSALIGVLGCAAFLIVGLVPVVFVEAGRRAGSIGKVGSVGLLAMAVLVGVIAFSVGILLYRAAVSGETPPADLWVSLFLAVVMWGVGVLTLVPGLVFLRLSNNRALDDFGARFFLEWALVYLLIATAALALGHWSLRSLRRAGSRPPAAATVTSN